MKKYSKFVKGIITDMERKSKNYRMIDLYVRFCEGKYISKGEKAKKFGIKERSLQRDIDDIRAFLSERCIEASDMRRIVYDRSKKAYVMEGAAPTMMENDEILAVSKIILASRAFSKKELREILEKMINGCAPKDNMKLVKELIANEAYHYVELNRKSDIEKTIWDIALSIHNHNLVRIEYEKANETDKTTARMIEPIAIMFSEYYFYLNAFIVEKNETGKYVHRYDYPAIFRIDRLKSYKPTDEKDNTLCTKRFEEGELRKRIQFMYARKLLNIKLKYNGKNPEPILDRLPTAKIVEQKADTYIIEAEVYGNGIIMWLLSQGSKVEVLKPESLRKEMIENLEEMLRMYKQDG